MTRIVREGLPPRRALGLSLLLLLVLLFLAGEAALRVVQRITQGTPVTSLLPGYRDARFLQSPFLVFGPRIDWEIPGREIQELARFNGSGYRLPYPTPPKVPGEFRIIALGGSTTENVWNSAGIHWPLMTQCTLADRGHSIRILNGGMSAYSSAHSLVRLLFGVLDDEPDMVLVMHAVNDLDAAYVAATRGLDVDGHYLVKYGTRGYTGEVGPDDVVLSRLLRAFRNRLLGPADPPLERTPLPDHLLEEGVRVFSRNLSSIIHIARAHNVQPVLLTMPASPFPEDYVETLAGRRGGQPGLALLPGHEVFLQHMGRYNQAQREVGESLGSDVVDMAAWLEPRAGDFVDPVHYSTEGIVRFGLTLAEILEPFLPPLPPGTPSSALPECNLLSDLGRAHLEAGTLKSSPYGGPVLVKGGILPSPSGSLLHSVVRWRRARTATHQR